MFWKKIFHQAMLTAMSLTIDVFFSGNIMTLNPGADSNDKNVDKVPAPINVPAVSLETKSVLLPETKANSRPFIISRDSESALPSQTHANGTTREWLIDPRLYMVSMGLIG